MSDDPSVPQTKAELLDRIRRGHTAFLHLLLQFTDEQLTAPGPDGGWSVKDHLAHLATWEYGIAALLQRQPRFQAMGVEEALRSGVGVEEFDHLNHLIYQNNRDRSLLEVLEFFRRSHQDLLNAIDRLDNSDLSKTYSYFQPDEPGPDSGAPIVNWIIANTYSHYDEHAHWIEALLGPDAGHEDHDH